MAQKQKPKNMKPKTWRKILAGRAVAAKKRQIANELDSGFADAMAKDSR